MEQIVMLAFGVIAVILGLVVVANVITTNKEDMYLISFKQSIDDLKKQCDFVCDSPIDSYLSINVELPSGTRIYTNDNRICGHLNISDEYDDVTKCVICTCQVSMDEPLDLQTELARKSFDKHTYSCYFGRIENGTQMECKG